MEQISFLKFKLVLKYSQIRSQPDPLALTGIDFQTLNTILAEEVD